MSRALKILKTIQEQENSIVGNGELPLDPKAIKQAFVDRLDHLNIEGISIDQVDVDIEGNIVVHFSDEDDDEMAILFIVDPDEGMMGIILDEDPDSDEVEIIDLDALNPVVKETTFGQYINLVDLSWVNKSAMMALLTAGSLEASPPKQVFKITQDAFGHDIRTFVPNESLNRIEELTKTVIRGGTKVRLPVVRRKRRKALTSKQKAGIRKGVNTRRAKKGQISRKLKKSLKVRSRSGLKRAKPGTAKNTRVRG